MASNGLLYGTTQSGGANGTGAIYSFNTTTFAYTKLADMSTANGTAPVAELVQASDGNLYGSASAGGANGAGTIFRYDLTAPGLTKLYDHVTADGSTPYGRMVQASNGLLYGMTYAGGPVPKLDTALRDTPHGTAFIDAEAQLGALRTLFRKVEAVALEPERSRDFIHGLMKEL